MSSSGNRLGVTPACLSSLAIYNPSFGTSEESLDEQIVYYHSKGDGERTGRKSASNVDLERENKERNERLRQIGLAQGMVEFAKGFSGGEAVDSIETEKCRIVLHELELGWWILASIDLTCITSVSEKSTNEQPRSTKEYSSREVASPALLLQQLLRAHRTFLLHHGASLGELYIRMERSKFCKILKRYWNHFICRWDVMLNGNPALGLFNGMKLAAGGELGVGVGEEEWGSGEREVLEAFIGRTEGLVDMVVSRFGDPPAAITSHSNPTTTTAQTSSASSCWQANGAHPRPSDGVIFSGIGTITRTSVRDVSCWAEDLFRYGQDTYGVRDNPSSARWRRRRKPSIEKNLSQPPASSAHESPGISDQRDTRKRTSSNVRQSPNGHGIPRSLINTVTGVSQAASSKPSENPPAPKEQSSNEESPSTVTETGTETMMKYLTLGVYGSKWGIPFRRPPKNPKISKLREDERAKSDSSGRESSSSRSVKLSDDMPGYYLIGFHGDLEGTVEEDERDEETWEQRALRQSDESQSSRTMIRTLHVQRMKPKEISGSSSSTITKSVKGISSLVEPYSDRLRVVVYVQEPFMFICLFELQTDALAIPTFYRSIHHQLGPLQPPLLTSTAPDKASTRLWEASLPKSTASTQSSQPIGDLVFDPTKLTIHTTIPNIPGPETSNTENNTSDTAPWSRIEALSVYSQILSTYESTRRRSSELERTCKTSRGWWVVWMRLPEPSEPSNSSLYREAFLIRKASDYTAPKARNVSARFGRDVTSTNAGWGPGKLAEGIGIDTRQYIEGLLTLNR